MVPRPGKAMLWLKNPMFFDYNVARFEVGVYYSDGLLVLGGSITWGSPVRSFQPEQQSGL